MTRPSFAEEFRSYKKWPQIGAISNSCSHFFVTALKKLFLTGSACTVTDGEGARSAVLLVEAETGTMNPLHRNDSPEEDRHHNQQLPRMIDSLRSMRPLPRSVRCDLPEEEDQWEGGFVICQPLNDATQDKRLTIPLGAMAEEETVHVQLEDRVEASSNTILQVFSI